jgi:hypothetical protein
MSIVRSTDRQLNALLQGVLTGSALSGDVDAEKRLPRTALESKASTQLNNLSPLCNKPGA